MIHLFSAPVRYWFSLAAVGLGLSHLCVQLCCSCAMTFLSEAHYCLSCCFGVLFCFCSATFQHRASYLKYWLFSLVISWVISFQLACRYYRSTDVEPHKQNPSAVIIYGFSFISPLAVCEACYCHIDQNSLWLFKCMPDSSVSPRLSHIPNALDSQPNQKFYWADGLSQTITFNKFTITNMFFDINDMIYW